MISIPWTGALCFLAVGLAYFYCPVADEMDSKDQWLLRKLYALSQAGAILSRIGSAVGYDSAVNISRQARNLRLLLINPQDYGINTQRTTFDGVSVKIHTKPSWNDKDRQPRPAIFYIHGGGWKFEFIELYAQLERYLAEQLDYVVVSVDYSLAPEKPYPHGFHDCVKAIKYLHVHASSLGIDPDRISVAGDSAGGNLATAVAIKLRDEGNSFLKSQVLISPAVQFASFRLKSFIENDRYAILTRRDVIKSWLPYINASVQFVNELETNEHVPKSLAESEIWPYLQKYQEFPQDHVKIDEKASKLLEKKLTDPYLSPLFAASLKDLPPTLLIISEFDVVRDEELAYADRLKAEGVETSVARNLGFHGIYCYFQNSKAGNDIVNSIIEFLRSINEKSKNTPKK